MMCLLAFKLLLLVFSVTTEQHQYNIVVENTNLEYVDHKYIDLTVGLFEIKHVHVVNVTATLKCELPEDTKVSARAYKLVGNDYRVPVLHARKTVKSALEMELFDLQTFLVHKARPPVVWPLKKGITYHSEGWVPDSTKFPPNLPDGKWKTVVTCEFANKTKLFTTNV